ncbi:MAG: aminotransferase class IV [Paraclostridium sp.]|uniref:aminotransferase class IV n=1 Tax=Paraclostridium sp. TaxID=2023273 RepID=UPI003F34A376
MKNNVTFNSGLSKFGIGLFETIRIDDGVCVCLDMHLDRIFKSINDLKLDINQDQENIKKILLDYVKRKNIKNKALRLTLFDEGYNISTRKIIYDESIYKVGFRLTVSPTKRGNNILYKHKTTNYFENIYMKRYALENVFDDTIFLDYKNNILECSMSNIFFIKDRKIYTPNKELPILNGIMKKRIEELCVELRINMIETDIKITEIDRFDFCFISNSLMGIMKVTYVDDTKFKDYSEVFDILWNKIVNLKKF